MPTVLVVEDEAAIAELIALNLRHAGFDVTLAESADQATAAIAAELPDLVLLDWMLPGQSGVALGPPAGAADERTQANCPSSCSPRAPTKADKVVGLDAGADDYLTKPFSDARAAGPHPRRAAPAHARGARQPWWTLARSELRPRPPAAWPGAGRGGEAGSDRVPPAAFLHVPPRARAQPQLNCWIKRLGRPRLYRRAHGRCAREALARGPAAVWLRARCWKLCVAQATA